MNSTTPGTEADFPGRDELLALLRDILPAGWAEAVECGDEEHVLSLRDDLDNPAIVKVLGDAGWVAPHFALGYGGRGLEPSQARQALTLLQHWQVPHVPRGAGMMLAAPTIDQWASDETKARLLPPLVSGEERWCQLFSEPGAGSDLASLATSAVRDGDEWIVNGQKVWTTLGHQAEMGMLIARTDPHQPKHKGITYFGVDLRSEGVEVRPLINIAGQLEFNEIFLTDVRVPDLHRVGEVGEGWGAAMTTLSAERFALSGMGKKKRKSSDEILGGKPLHEVRAMAKERGATTSSEVCSGVEAIARQELTKRYIEGEVLRLTAGRARARRAAGLAAGPEGSISKIAKAATNQRLQETAMSLLGPASIAWEADDAEGADWATQFLRTRANSIEGGTSEIQRNIVGERVLGLPREPDPFKGAAWKDVPRS